MKNSKFLLFAAVTIIAITSCNKKDEVVVVPEPVNEEEVITTVKLVLTPIGGGTVVTLQSRDLDGEGPGMPVVTPAAPILALNKTYDGEVIVLNETVTPAKNTSAEILSEAADHQFFYQTTGTLPMFAYTNVALQPTNFDTNGKPVGFLTKFVTTTASSGSLKITLRHQGDKSKPNVVNGDITNATGETDFEVNFPNISVQ